MGILDHFWTGVAALMALELVLLAVYIAVRPMTYTDEGRLTAARREDPRG